MTVDNNKFEGLFRVFSSNMDITLDQVHKIDPDDVTKISPETVKDTMVFPFHKVVAVTAVDVDLEYAAKGNSLSFDICCSFSNKL